MNVQPGILNLLNESDLIVLKLGSKLLWDDDNDQLNQTWLNSLMKEVSACQKMGTQLIIVSSGAIRLGRTTYDINGENDLVGKQVASALGMPMLIDAFTKASWSKIAPALLSERDLNDEHSIKNTLNAIQRMLKDGIIPIVNENDLTATREITFGDNDQLAALLAKRIQADMLIILSTVGGLYTDDPVNPDAEHIPFFNVGNINNDVRAMAKRSSDVKSVGGMTSKLQAVELAAHSGVTCIIGDGRPQNPLTNLTNPVTLKTLIVPKDFDDRFPKPRAHTVG